MTAEISSAAPAKKPFWFRRRLVPVPTWKTWLVLLTIPLLLAAWIVPRLHGWLAVNDPLPDAPYIIVEGWVPDYVLEEVVAHTRERPVQRIFTTGVPLDRGTFLSEFRNYAELCAASLAKPAGAAKIERTRAMAAALKEVLDKENIPAADRRINLYSLGTHGHRSRKIFQQTLGPDWQVGVLSVPSEDYVESTWYRQSAGAKTVLNELIALGVQGGGGD
jgi:hypothetical protein